MLEQLILKYYIGHIKGVLIMTFEDLEEQVKD